MCVLSRFSFFGTSITLTIRLQGDGERESVTTIAQKRTKRTITLHFILSFCGGGTQQEMHNHAPKWNDSEMTVYCVIIYTKSSFMNKYVYLKNTTVIVNINISYYLKSLYMFIS